MSAQADENESAGEILPRRRDETPADAAFRFALFCLSRPPGEDFAFLDPSVRDMLLRQQFQGQIAGYRAQFPQARHQILEIEQLPIGRVVVDLDADALQIVDLAIMPEWRCRGIGARLLRALVREARAAGVPARFHSFLHNVDGNRLFLRLGFAPIARTELQIVWELHGDAEPAIRHAPARP